MAKSGGRLAMSVVIVAVVGAAVAMKFLGGGVAPVPAVFAARLSLEQAIERSTASGKPVMVLATADWCGPCQRFKRGPLSDPVVARYIGEHFEAVYMDVDEQGELASKLGVESIPAVRILRPGRAPAALDGYAEKDQLMKWLEGAVTG
ncbi:MAG: thioredoxin family protein [Phycisphaerales bacterium]|nr:thioredoxin family protein [Phycisphaerales bacterium]